MKRRRSERGREREREKRIEEKEKNCRSTMHMGSIGQGGGGTSQRSSDSIELGGKTGRSNQPHYHT
jgi:hypothetical protein